MRARAPWRSTISTTTAAASATSCGRTVSGGATINDTVYHFAQEELPFGGIGASGMGSYHGRDGFNTFSHAKGTFLQSRLTPTSLMTPPYDAWFQRIIRFADPQPRRLKLTAGLRRPLLVPNNTTGGSGMAVQRLGIIMNGVTGRMGTNQHLVRSIVAIRKEGGVALRNGDRVMPDPILVGRNPGKLSALADAHGIKRTSTDLDAALADDNDTVFFDAATTQARPTLLGKAIDAGKHIYCEKPVATNLEEAVAIVRKAKAAGIKHGVVQDKLFLPGLRKLKLLIDFGLLRPHPVGARRVRLLGVRGRPAADPAAVLELPRRGRRRHHPRHALPLALRARQHLRQRQVRLLPRRHAHPRAHRRGRQALQGHRRRCRLRHLPARRQHHRPHQQLLGDARAPRRPARPCTSTARTARPWPACRMSSPSSAWRRRSRSGTPT